MLPKAVPELTEAQFAFLEKEIQRKHSAKDKERLERAKEIYKKYPVKS
jgi:hypothetical protein